MKSKSQLAYEKVQKRLLMAPGMIEESERRLLFKAAFNCSDLPVVEFGAFFGASTLALACGLSARQKNVAPLTCIDAFEANTDQSFHKYVISYAKNCKAEKLLQTDGSKTNWMKITKAVLGSEAKNVRLIKGVVNDNFDMALLPEKIGLLHLDLPKDAETMRPILKGAFTKLTRGSIIAFQDYAYQFSNELISLFELLEQQDYIKSISIAASSMFFEVKRDSMSATSLTYLLEKAIKDQTILIEEAIGKYQKHPKYRAQELIALNGAAIQALKTSNKLSTSFSKQAKIKKHIQIMNDIEPNHTSQILSQLLTH